jgi:predicted metalloprotease with PDZ domain
VAAQILYSAGGDYDNYRRNVDYYPEGTLIWLEADTMIRQLSKGAKSLDDFCRAFHGGPGGAPALKPYEFADVVAGLNAVQPADWTGFFNQRIKSTSEHAPLGGIEASGWKLVYDGVRSDFWRASEDDRKETDLSYSIGLKVREDGTIADVQYGGPAQKGGVAPAVKLIAVNNRQFTPTVLREAVAATASSDKLLELLIKTGEFYEVHRVDYRGGEKYPHLVQDPGKPDLLSEIIKAQAK